MVNNSSTNTTICYLGIQTELAAKLNTLFLTKVAVKSFDSDELMLRFLTDSPDICVIIIGLTVVNPLALLAAIFEICQTNPVFIFSEPESFSTLVAHAQERYILDHEVFVITADSWDDISTLISGAIKKMSEIRSQIDFITRKHPTTMHKDILQEQHLWEPFNQLATGIIALRLNGIIAYANNTAIAALNIDQQDYIQQTILTYFNAKQHARLTYLLVEAISNSTTSITITIRPSKNDKHLAITAGKYTGNCQQFLLLSCHDVTANILTTRKLLALNHDMQVKIDAIPKMMEQFAAKIKIEKATSLGYLAVGIAHTINNPLAGISIALTNISNRLLRQDQHNMDIAQQCGTTLNQITDYIQQQNITVMHKDILEQIQRISNIIKNMLIYGSTTINRPMDYYNINTLVKNAINLAKMEKNIHKKLIFTDINIIEPNDIAPILVFCNHGEIGLVLFHLLKNAAESLNRIEDETMVKNIHIKCYLQNNYCCIEITDNGEGVDDTSLAQIFEPFFSTDRKLAGLGLAICQCIVEQHHHGKIYLKNNSDIGATFAVELPTKKNANPTNAKTTRGDL